VVPSLLQRGHLHALEQLERNHAHSQVGLTPHPRQLHMDSLLLVVVTIMCRASCIAAVVAALSPSAPPPHTHTHATPPLPSPPPSSSPSCAPLPLPEHLSFRTLHQYVHGLLEMLLLLPPPPPPLAAPLLLLKTHTQPLTTPLTIMCIASCIDSSRCSTAGLA